MNDPGSWRQAPAKTASAAMKTARNMAGGTNKSFMGQPARSSSVTASWSWGSARTAPGENHRDGLQDEVDVVLERPVIDVLHVEVHPLFEADLVAAADLPDARQAGAHREAAPLPGFVLGDLGRERRARAHDAHVSAEHVDELRQLVDRV